MGLTDAAYKDFSEGCKVLVGLDLALLNLRAHSMVGVRKGKNSCRIISI